MQCPKRLRLCFCGGDRGILEDDEGRGPASDLPDNVADGEVRRHVAEWKFAQQKRDGVPLPDRRAVRSMMR